MIMRKYVSVHLLLKHPLYLVFIRVSVVYFYVFYVFVVITVLYRHEGIYVVNTLHR